MGKGTSPKKDAKKAPTKTKKEKSKPQKKKKKRGRGRTKGSKNKNRRDVKLNTEMTQVQSMLRQVLVR